MPHHWHSKPSSANSRPVPDPEEPVPTYQYACTECGHQLEAVQSFSDEPLTECPACTGRLRKVFNSVGIVFKGSGFYRTDSRSTGSETNGGATKPAKSESSTDGGANSSGGANSGGAAKDGGSSSGGGSSNGSTAKGGDAKGNGSAGGSGSKYSAGSSGSTSSSS